MPKRINPEDFGITPFKPGDPIFETERVANFDYSFLKSGNKDEEVILSSLFKPDEDEFKGLSKGLEFLKFDEETAKELYNLIGGAIKIASSIATVIGIVSTVSDIAEKLGLLSSEEDQTMEKIEKIGKRTEQMYEYLEKKEARGLYKEALGWRIANTKAKDEKWNVRVSRSKSNLDNLNTRAADLDGALGVMLDPGNAKISFRKSVYGYRSFGGHWIDAAGTPALTLASGDILPNYSAESSDLKEDIWDAGHYIDVLFLMLRERLLIATTLEPAYRSTAYELEKLSTIAENLELFIEQWRSSLLVANPAVGINGGKQLYNPFADSAAHGILIGAVDPVTGISTLKTFEGFAIKYSRTDLPGAAWGGVWDESYAVEPEKALATAMSEHAQLVDTVIRTCGISSLIKLQREYRNASSSTTRSQFVKLPNAKFRRISFFSPINPGSNDYGTPETIDLGGIKIFADPNKTYEATRFHRVFEKTFRFKMARRTEISETQLGYRLRIADKDIVLCKFSTRPAAGIEFVHFPKEPIEVEHSFDTEVYDCCQVRHFSAGDEDKFESEGENGERIFFNKREGRSRIRISIHFEPLADGKSDAYAGEAVITIRNLEPEVFPDAFILDISVFETIIEGPEEQKELVPDLMTIHMTPSYLIVGQDFIDDYRKTLAFMTKVITSTNDKYSISKTLVPPRPVPDPTWNVRHQALKIENGLAFIKAALLEHPALITEEINRFRPFN